MKKTKIIILGGGFAGLYAAMYLDKTLARRPDMEITLISRDNFFLFTPMLHEVAGGDLYPADIVNPIRRIIRHIKFVEASALIRSARRPMFTKAAFTTFSAPKLIWRLLPAKCSGRRPNLSWATFSRLKFPHSKGCRGGAITFSEHSRKKLRNMGTCVVVRTPAPALN